MQDKLFLTLARKVVYISSIAVFGTIASIVLYATFAAFSGPSSGPSAANHSRGLLYDYMFGSATNSGAVQQGSGWTAVPTTGTSALAGTINEKLNFMVSKLLTGISTAALDGVYDSTAVTANKNGNALNMLKYIQQGIDSAGAAGAGASGCENMDVYQSGNWYYVCVAGTWKQLLMERGITNTGNMLDAALLKHTFGKYGSSPAYTTQAYQGLAMKNNGALTVIQSADSPTQDRNEITVFSQLTTASNGGGVYLTDEHDGVRQQIPNTYLNIVKTHTSDIVVTFKWQ